jgi:hypothetical protein
MESAPTTPPGTTAEQLVALLQVFTSAVDAGRALAPGPFAREMETARLHVAALERENAAHTLPLSSHTPWGAAIGRPGDPGSRAAGGDGWRMSQAVCERCGQQYDAWQLSPCETCRRQCCVGCLERHHLYGVVPNGAGGWTDKAWFCRECLRVLVASEQQDNHWETRTVECCR